MRSFWLGERKAGTHTPRARDDAVDNAIGFNGLVGRVTGGGRGWRGRGGEYSVDSNEVWTVGYMR